MNLTPLDVRTVLLGAPLLCDLYAEGARVLLRKGQVIHSEEELQALTGGRQRLFIDLEQSPAHLEAAALTPQTVESPSPVAAQRARPAEPAKPDATRTSKIFPDWHTLPVRANSILTECSPSNFMARLNRLHGDLMAQVDQSPDALLFALFHLSATELRLYSATHAMLVCAMTTIAARDVLKWPLEQVHAIGKASLTMNIAMTEMQDQLCHQRRPLSSAQKQLVDQHAARSAEQLIQLGVTDPLWLGAVRHHHDDQPSPLDKLAPVQRLSRLIQRADIYSARLAPRAGRSPMSHVAAMKASYFDREQQVDEAGSALIKAVGVYAPGTFVRLASNELAISLRRGPNTSAPLVAAFAAADKRAGAEPILRDTSLQGFKVLASIPRREVAQQVEFKRLINLI